ncbi:biopolymer transporter ExbD [Thermaurantimonas aggregans]|uniref:Biopolymer transporter ExbD n=1 Tax=Thermaurantimonas aggregans TaxID=2173829 RepID=A0A401XM66_9FLAO|nr:biopolymer transporter ExbD [Thermaurantimonas aggregans]MCX8147962.1 biopolymer transporter ExbD [Thermaurantimonas aggregans]GCD78093.1 biopolymer transporter ExbD [Thermaurantimonas aggregans]
MKETTSKKAQRWRKKILESGVDLDMNPMVDMAFLLLTFFMLTTTLTRPFAMELIMPAEEKQQESERPAIKASRVLVLIPYKQDTVLYYQGLPEGDFKKLLLYDVQQTENFFTAFKNSVKDPVIFIKPTASAPYETVVHTIDALNNHGLNRYALDELNDQESKFLQP